MFQQQALNSACLQHPEACCAAVTEPPTSSPCFLQGPDAESPAPPTTLPSSGSLRRSYFLRTNTPVASHLSWVDVERNPKLVVSSRFPAFTGRKPRLRLNLASRPDSTHQVSLGSISFVRSVLVVCMFSPLDLGGFFGNVGGFWGESSKEKRPFKRLRERKGGREREKERERKLLVPPI